MEENNTQNTDAAEEKVAGFEVKGSLNYEILLRDNEYSVKWDRDVEPEMAAYMVVREGIKFAKQNLEASIGQLRSLGPAKAKELKGFKNRLRQIKHTEMIIGMICDDMAHAVIDEKRVPSADQGETKVAENLDLNNVVSDLKSAEEN